MSAKRIFLSPPWMGGSEQAKVQEAFASNYIAPCGPMVERFERDFAAAVGLPAACALSSCTAALQLLAHELDVQRGDIVFCSTLTFVASIAPFVQRGATPVFIDSDAATWNLDPFLLEEALADAHKKGKLPRAVVAVDLYGQCCDYDCLESACNRYGVPLIIDAAEALGATYKGRAAGVAGWAAVYSFNGNKIITTSGGGMLAARDETLVARARKRSQQAREAVTWYEHAELGYNHRLSNILAAIGVGQLELLPEILRRKRALFAQYQQRLSAAGFSFMPEAAYGCCSRWLTVAQIEDDRAHGDAIGPRVQQMIQKLEAADIEARPVWKPMHRQPVFQGTTIYGGAVSEALFRQGLCLPSGAALTADTCERICERICAC